MAEYIEREALINELKNLGWDDTSVTDIVEWFPAADVAPVRHGEWKWKNSPYDVNIYICSVCEKQVSILGNKLRYCPNCGAKMDFEKLSN